MADDDITLFDHSSDVDKKTDWEEESINYN